MSIPHEILKYATKNHGLVRRKELKDADLSNKQIRQMIGTGELVAVHSNVYRVGGAVECWEQRLLAACIATKGVASHRAALRLWLPPTGKGTPDDTVEVTAGRSHVPRLKGVVAHCAPDLADMRPCHRAGIPVTTPQRRLVDLAAVVDAETLTRAVEQCVVSRLLTIATIRTELERLPPKGRRGVTTMRTVLADWPLGDVHPDGHLDAAFARLCRSPGLPLPSVQ
jgi:hypothetical protein